MPVKEDILFYVLNAYYAKKRIKTANFALHTMIAGK